jgi:NADPH:quinone reductase-like Zn-dependent oxidoreductase
MHAIRFHTFGDPDVLRLEEVDRPVPEAGQVLIKVAGTSFNPVDATFRAGYLQQVMPIALPHTLGVDVAGTIVEAPTEAGTSETGSRETGPRETGPGKGAQSEEPQSEDAQSEDARGEGGDVQGEGGRLRVGDAVIGFLPMTSPGAAAEFAVAPAAVLAAAPSSVPLADAAAIPAVALTAWQGLFEHIGLQSGRRVLINGAGGGVGGYAVQFAKQIGATVIATASPRSTESVRAAGADQIVDYTATAVTDAVDGAVDAVFNLVDGDEAAMAGLVGLIKPGGVLVSTASPAPEDAERKVRTMNMYVRSDAAQLAEIVRRIDAGTVTVDVSARYPLAETARVHERSATGDLRGKVVLTP